MDLVNYDRKVFEDIKTQYEEFLREINLKPTNFIPIAAREGENIIGLSAKMPWYKELSVLQALDNFTKAAPNHARELRFPIQDIYKFTAQGDDRRIFAGRVESGSVAVGDDVVFFRRRKPHALKVWRPSLKRSIISLLPGKAPGFTARNSSVRAPRRDDVQSQGERCRTPAPNSKPTFSGWANSPLSRGRITN